MEKWYIHLEDFEERAWLGNKAIGTEEKWEMQFVNEEYQTAQKESRDTYVEGARS